MVRSLAAASLLLAITTCPHAVVAMFEDEAGANDWHKQQLGTITALHVSPNGRLLAASDAAVIASIHPANGTLAWRHVLDERDVVRATVAVRSTGLVTLTGPGAEARYWNATNGNLMWDKATREAGNSAEAVGDSRVAAAASQDGTTVYTASGSDVSAITAVDGQTQWQWSAASDAALSSSLGNDDKVVVTAVQPLAGGKVLAAGYSYKSKGGSTKIEHMFTVDLPDKRSIKTVKVGKYSLDAATGVILLAKPSSTAEDPQWAAVALPANGKSLAVLDPANGHLSELSVDIGAAAAAIAPLAEGALLHIAGSDGSSSSGVAALASSSGSSLELVSAVKCGGAASSSSSSSDCVVGGTSARGRVFAVKAERASQQQGSSSSSSPVKLTVQEVAEGKSIDVSIPSVGGVNVNLSFNLPIEERGVLRAVFPEVVVTNTGAVKSVGALVLSADASAVMLRTLASAAAASKSKGSSSSSSKASSGALQQAWVREEALAAITSVDFVDTAAAVGRSVDHHTPSYSERLKLHWEDISSSLISGLSLMRAGSSDAPVLQNSGFGLSKLAIATTAASKLCAISTITGEIVWSKLLPTSTASSDSSSSTEQQTAHTVYVTRPRSVLGYPPEFALLSTDASGDAVIGWYDALTGQRSSVAAAGAATAGAEKSELVIKGGVSSVVPLELHDAEGRQILMIVSKDNSVTIAPSTAEAYTHVKPLLSALYHHKIDDAGLRTYAVTAKNTAEELPQLSSVQVGALNWGGDSVVAVAYPLRRELIPTSAAVLGDDSLLLKYLNPHLAVVATMAAGASSAADAASKDAAAAGGSSSSSSSSSSSTGEQAGSTLQLWLVDTVSGRVLYRLKHEGAAGPVHCVVSENNVVCTHWNAKARRTEITSISLYEGMIGKYGLGPLRQPERHAFFSSFDALPPIALHRTYILPHAVTGAGLPLTAHGVTAKNVLLALKGGQVLSLDRRLLDPRRPANDPTKAEIEEKLVKYQPFIPVQRLSVITYGLQVGRAAHIATAPTTLESTSVLLVSGLDVFCTRVIPSKTFDLLSPTFNYGLLLLVIAALTAGNFAAGMAARRKALAAQWA